MIPFFSAAEASETDENDRINNSHARIDNGYCMETCIILYCVQSSVSQMPAETNERTAYEKANNESFSFNPCLSIRFVCTGTSR